MTVKKVPKPRLLGELERQCQVMPEDYLVCRELKHAWGPYTAEYVKGRRNEIARTLRCTRCNAQKDQLISGVDGGLLWSSGIFYPEGYLFTGVGRLTSEAMGVIRLASVTNQLVKGVSVG